MSAFHSSDSGLSGRKPLRILFAGTPEIAVPSLRTLASEGEGLWEIAGVLTNPDRRAGRGRKAHPPPVKAAAEELGLPVFQPERLDGEFRDRVAALHPDLLAVIAYGRIFGPRFLALFPRGGINMHPSPLPRHRGPSPLAASIRAGDTETAITIQQLALRMDSGDILLQDPLPLDPRETAGSLAEKAAREAAPRMAEVVGRIARGPVEGRPQEEEEATTCSLLTKEDGRLKWSRSAEELDRVVRACSPWPTAWTLWEGTPLKIHRAHPAASKGSEPEGPHPCPGTVLRMDKGEGILVQTGDGVLALERLQLPGKKPLDCRAFLNGNREILTAVLAEKTSGR